MSSTCTRTPLAGFVGFQVILWATAAALATDRFYPDKTAHSPNGRYRLEATSPHNSGQARPFAREFTYTFTDLASEQVLWTRTQGDESSPVSLFVSDEMWVVIRTGRDELVALRPISGEIALNVQILEQFDEPERGRYVHWTTAGPMWSGRSHWYFLDHNDQAHFVIRAWWDRRIVANLTGSDVLDSVPAEVAAACDEAERKWALETLKRLAPAVEQNPDTNEGVGELMLAAHLTSRFRMKEAAPLLRHLERSEYVGSSTAMSGMGLWREYSLRQVAQHALRQVGEVPGNYPGTCVTALEGDFPRPSIAPGPPRSKRAERVDDVRKGMTLKQLVGTIGHPDVIARGYEYDIDGPEPYTLLVTIQQHGGWRSTDYRVESIERVVPPRWQQGDERVEALMW